MKRPAAAHPLAARLLRLLWCGLPLALACSLNGCLSRPALVHQAYALHPEALVKSVGCKVQGVVALAPVQVSPFFQGRSFVYRVAANRYESDPYAEFIVPPSRALGIALRGCLRNSGLFREVAETGSQQEADTWLEVHARDLYGDFRTPGGPAAVLSMKLLLFEAPNGQPQNLLLQRDYSQRVPLKEQTAAALAAGWDQALAQIVMDAASDVAAARGNTISQ